MHLNILEQNYRSDVASQYNLLRAYEGKELDFQYGSVGQIVHGRLIRAGATCGGNGCYGGNAANPSSKSMAKSNSDCPVSRSFPHCRTRSC